MPLYAATDEDIRPHGTYQMSGNQTDFRTLDLGRPFEEIGAQRELIAEGHFSA